MMPKVLVQVVLMPKMLVPKVLLTKVLASKVLKLRVLILRVLKLRVLVSGIYLCTRGTSSVDACIDSAGAIKRSRMHLQSFQNLEVGDAGLEIHVRAGCIKSTCIGSAIVCGSSGRLSSSFSFRCQMPLDILLKFSSTSRIWSMSKSFRSLLYFIKISFSNISN